MHIEEQIVRAIINVTGAGKFALHEPNFDGNEINYLRTCIETTMVSYLGPFVDKFEFALTEKTGAKYCFSTNSGTSALHLALLAIGVNKNDEILLPALNFVASANAICYCNAIPHFLDVNGKTLTVDVHKLENYLSEISQMKEGICVNKISQREIKAIIVMHIFGHPVDMNPLMDIAKKYNLIVIEDAAEAVGSLYHGQHVGTFGDLGVLSFNGNKIITTGGGGAVITNNINFYHRLKHLGTTAKVQGTFEFQHDEVGYNYRMPNINAAIGLAQLEQLDGKIDQKRALTALYQNALSDVKAVQILKEPAFTHSNYWLQTLILDKDLKPSRNKIINRCHENGLFVRPVWTPLSQLPPFQKCPKMDLSVTEDFAHRVINLPSSPTIGR